MTSESESPLQLPSPKHVMPVSTGCPVEWFPPLSHQLSAPRYVGLTKTGAQGMVYHGVPKKKFVVIGQVISQLEYPWVPPTTIPSLTAADVEISTQHHDGGIGPLFRHRSNCLTDVGLNMGRWWLQTEEKTWETHAKSWEAHVKSWVAHVKSWKNHGRIMEESCKILYKQEVAPERPPIIFQLKPWKFGESPRKIDRSW